MKRNSIYSIFAIIAIATILMMPTGTAYGAKINGTPGNDVLIGTNGKDTINGKGGDDVIDGAGGKDTIKGAGGDDSIDGGPGDDNISGGADDDFIIGEDGNDDLAGGEGADTILGGAGDDIIDGGNGDDDLNGGSGADDIKGGSGDDNIWGGNGDDLITGSAGDDMVSGQFGADTLFADSGNDFLFGGVDDDLLVGNLLRGVNTFDCGPGSDSVWWDGGFTGGTIVIGTDVLGDIFADDVIVGASCEPATTFDLFNPAVGDPAPPGGAPPTQPPANVPDAVTDLSATDFSPTRVDLSWSAPNDNGSPIIGYDIERAVDGGAFALIDTTTDASTTFSDTSATSSVENIYRVSAINGQGTGSASNEASEFPGLADAPTSLTALLNVNDIDLSWTAPPAPTGSAVSGYLIERSIDGAVFAVLVDTSPDISTTFTDISAVVDSANTYRVSAINAEGTGTPSNEATETPGATSEVIGVSNITVFGQGGKDQNKDILVTFTVLGEGAQAIEGATVTMSFTLDGNPLPQESGTTLADGTVTFKEKNAADGVWSAILVEVIPPNASFVWDFDTAIPANTVTKP